MSEKVQSVTTVSNIEKLTLIETKSTTLPNTADYTNLNIDTSGYSKLYFELGEGTNDILGSALFYLDHVTTDNTMLRTLGAVEDADYYVKSAVFYYPSTHKIKRISVGGKWGSTSNITAYIKIYGIK